MSGRWYRVYDDLINDPKWLQLDHSSRSALVELWCIASSEKVNGGILPPLEELAIRLRTRPQWLKKRISRLQEVGLIDFDEKGLRPHNWGKRQFEERRVDPTNAARQKRYRKKHGNVIKRYRNAPDTDTEGERPKGLSLPPLTPPAGGETALRLRFAGGRGTDAERKQLADEAAEIERRVRYGEPLSGVANGKAR